jgi:cytochrome P450/NADPH-cytochrome P450 reductase
MGDCFNSLYREKQLSFVGPMINTLTEAFARSRRLPLPSAFYAKEGKEVEAYRAGLVDISKKLIAAQRSIPNGKKVLLNAMLFSKDTKSGGCRDDLRVVRSMVTFLVTGSNQERLRTS